MKSPYVNAVDVAAATAGTRDGLGLALNVAAMLIVFIAFVAMFDAILASVKLRCVLATGYRPGLLSPRWGPRRLVARGKVFGWIFSPAAFLMGVDMDDISKVASLLGQKLAINEHYAYLQMKPMVKNHLMTPRSLRLAAFALTGFANFASVGIQLGGIGAMAPERQHDLRPRRQSGSSSASWRRCSTRRWREFCLRTTTWRWDRGH